MAAGYLNRPALTRERFLSCDDLSLPGERVYRSGDLARQLPGGDLEYIGRGDRQVKIRGFRIEMGEIETRLLLHPEVREAAVICAHPKDHSLSPPTGGRLIAYLVFRGQPLSVSELRSYLKQTLPDHMVPSRFVEMDALPLTANGKLDTAALPPDTAGRRPTVGREFGRAGR